MAMLLKWKDAEIKKTHIGYIARRVKKNFRNQVQKKIEECYQ
jgi:hypothetical protein